MGVGYKGSFRVEGIGVDIVDYKLFWEIFGGDVVLVFVVIMG